MVVVVIAGFTGRGGVGNLAIAVDLALMKQDVPVRRQRRRIVMHSEFLIREELVYAVRRPSLCPVDQAIGLPDGRSAVHVRCPTLWSRGAILVHGVPLTLPVVRDVICILA